MMRQEGSVADPVMGALAFAHGVLPDQGPIGVFVHHNTLHAFQHLSFHEAVQAGAPYLGARPYPELSEFRAAFAAGRISTADIDVVLHEYLAESANDMILPWMSRLEVCRALMLQEFDIDDANGLRFAIRHGVSLVLEDRNRWTAVTERVAQGPPRHVDSSVRYQRHRDVLVAHHADDPDIIVHAELVRLAAGFVDQGQAHTVLPGREAGFLAAVAALYASAGTDPRGCRGITNDFRRIHEEGISSRSVIDRSLEALGVDVDSTHDYLVAMATALPGWAGMFARLERHPEEHAGVPTRLDEFLAVRLVIERRAIEHACAKTQLPFDWRSLRARIPAVAPRDSLLDAYLLWGLAHIADVPPDAIRRISPAELSALWALCREFSDVRRRQCFLEAYERFYRRQILDAIAARRPLGVAPGAQRAAQFVFCIDEREESMRRAVEEQGSEYETFGVAGFFGVAIDYQGLYDHTPVAYCPVVVTPAHEVHERAHPSDLTWHERRLRLRARAQEFERQLSRRSHSLTGGAGLSFVLGPLAGAAVAGRVMAPRRSLALRDRLTARFAPPPRTQLSTLRTEWDQQLAQRGKPLGFMLDESAERVAGVLRSIGLVEHFAPVVFVLGHGSTSLNNPHESAHDCGACGGRRGGANARLFAELANRPDVREAVKALGVDIPSSTIFVGGLHDTADDRVTLFDVDVVPASHRASFAQGCAVLEVARRENARERARRFDDAPLGLSPAAALAHVEARAAHLAQPRPEYGHCTNAIAVVGRRAITRALHLDRRAFLISYDATIDPTAAILERILAAVGPVGAGISLEYYFSSVDNERFGCGTKLPHNVTGLVGVINGHQGDLRTGLPLQMVELHEPMRLLLIVESTPDALLQIASRQAEVRELVVNEWVQLVSVDPLTGAMHHFHGGAFVPYHPEAVTLPVVERSPEWHGTSRAFVTPAIVRSALEVADGPRSAAHVGAHQ